ncbi:MULTISPECIES: response regulator [unclassified Rhizobium]|uniref:response regulator n=1 Tax=unclassified Rhizobium TaxID=2613769 RepID=UPI00160D9495|nr:MULTISPECIES: response regulator [unclassified Rhizobium]MBB3384323.1 two-component system phosphate regulon response regulator OmpR [Rhizobium sp. BK098]MBB3616317.1 two-component system phosphate regulon response regulator OmpR [Rhizobium sp. BK609]MBB3681976.1 two-component system phosphate regulon response regulator OmpR [Rhizobium sp. BK612]
MTLDQQRREHLLVVDDDPRIRQMLTRYFEDEGYVVSTASNGPEMRASLQQENFDIILLDWVLPGGEDGLDLAREIRAQSDIPIIMLTGRDDVVDRIVGIEVGADDYIAKPFHLREVHARLKSILRRRQPAAKARENEPGDVLRFEGWQLDIGKRQLLSPDKNEIELTTGEFDMLVVFARHAGRVLSRDFLMEATRGRNLEVYDRTIDAQIARLRKKIEADPTHPQLIKSIRGVGYVFTGKQ